MSVVPTYAAPGAPVTISSASPYSIGFDGIRLAFNFATGSSAWPSANRAYYVPFAIPTPIIVAKLFTTNGTTASNNFDIGIYDKDGTRIVSTGSTAQSGTTALQIVDVSDTLIGPGLFYMALAMNGTTGTHHVFGSISATFTQACGVYLQASAFPLPANATYAANATTYLPVFGLITTAAI